MTVSTHLSLRDVAERLGVSIKTVRGWVASRRITYMSGSARTIRVSEAALAEFIRKRTVEARA